MRLFASLCVGVLSLGMATSAFAAPVLLSEYDDSLTNLVSGAPDGTAVGGVNMVAGKIGDYAMSFDGSTGYVKTTNAGYPKTSAYGAPSNGLWTGSVSFWINKSSISTTSNEVILGGLNDGTNENFQIATGKDPANLGRTLRLYFRDTDTAVMDIAMKDTGWIDGQWHLATICWNLTTGASGTGTAEFYIDGVEKAGTWGVLNPNTITSSSSLAAWQYDVRIGTTGRATPLSGYYYAGYLDDLSVWNGKLTSTEAKALFSVGNDSVLNYNASDANTLFGIYAAQGQGATSDGLVWEYVTGLSTGSLGELINHNTLILGGSEGDWSGVRVVPEPGAITLLMAGLIGLICYAWRRRK